MSKLTKKELAAKIDHTVLKAVATPAMVATLCEEAISIGAASVCVNPVNVKQVSELLKGTGVKTCSVVGFPLGANTPEVKAFETKEAVKNGAEEIDMVINIGALKAGDVEAVYKDIKAVVDASGKALVKVIIETCYLTDEEKIEACKAATRAGAAYVKTSTGMGTAGTNPHDIALMKANISEGMKVKASGFMRKLEDVLPNLEAGAERLGLSGSIPILAELDE
jgi:deoxyribose-phosphate aldolase